jgi:hypothetical protein
MQLSPSLIKNDLYGKLFVFIDRAYGTEFKQDIVAWASDLLLDGQPVDFASHPYQVDMLKEDHPRQCFLKGAQVGITSVRMIKTIYSLIDGRFSQGALYLFPSQIDVQDFSRGRFGPLIKDNEQLQRFVEPDSVDAQTIKRIGKAVLYLRGARSTHKIRGLKRSASQLKSVPADSITYDEMDEMSPDMITLAQERLSHSTVKEEIYLSTPSVPDFGIDALFKESDQRYWFIKCDKCGHKTCLELEFPECLIETSDGRVIRACKRCSAEIRLEKGRWIPLHPSRSKELVGWRISQLNSAFVDPGKILSAFRRPPHGNITEVYNSKLAQAHVEAENRLTVEQVLALCDPSREMLLQDLQMSYMGVDVGSTLHCTIARPHWNGKLLITRIAEVPGFQDLTELMRKYHIERCVIDGMPEIHKCREFAQAHPGKVFLCYYSESQKGGPAWNDDKYQVNINRTEALDQSHFAIAAGEVILPSQNEAVNEFAKHCSNIARVLHKDEDTGMSKYMYIQTGPDHLRHSWGYCYLALLRASTGFFSGCDLA